jgi:predicted HTH domain antitoxin
MIVTLPEDIPVLQKMTESELKQELALSLYVARRVTIVQAAHIAALNLFDFQGLLRERQISQHYDENDFEKDLGVLRELDAE